MCVVWKSQRVANSHNFWVHSRIFIHTQTIEKISTKSFKVHVAGYMYKIELTSFHPLSCTYKSNEYFQVIFFACGNYQLLE